jgi:hypothetical protein
VRPSAVSLLSAGIAVVLLAALIASAASAHGSKTSPICKRGLTTVAVDPRGLLPLAANPISPSASAALRYARSGNPQVVRADLATADQERGGGARFDCGTRVWRRTVVVYITRRAFKNSGSLSESVFFVGRFKGGYRVWQVVH